MADNELKELYEQGVSTRQMDAAKKRYAEDMKLMNPPSENKTKGIELKLGPSNKAKPTDLNPVAKKKGGKDRKSTRLNSSHSQQSRMPSSA